MADRDYKAFIVEGEVREPQIIENISKVFFTHDQFKIITLPAGENIYMLWKKLEEDDFETDIIEVLRENNGEVAEQLAGLSRDDFSEVYLFFDYDTHQNNMGKENNTDAVAQMLESFDNETENGKLYISYPMVEALRDYRSGICGSMNECYVPIESMRSYKYASSERTINPQFNKYDYSIWKDIIDVFAMRASCLFEEADTLEYERYSEMANPLTIYAREKIKTAKKGVFVLSAFPEFLVDYYGVKLWRSCVKHSRNQRYAQNCW